MKKSAKRVTTLIATLCIMALITTRAFAATQEIVKDGTFQNTGFINAGEVVDGTIQGPGNWTQLNLGDAAIDAPYLHIIMKATGETETAQIVVSDRYTVNLSDLGIALTEEYQDVVLPVGEQDLDMLSWMNFMGLDGESSVYTIKDIFLSDVADPTIELNPVQEAEEEVATEETPTEVDAPKTGISSIPAFIAMGGMLVSALILIRTRKVKEA